MKRFIFLFGLILITLTIYAQRFKVIYIGDSLYLNGKWIKGAQEISQIPTGSVIFIKNDSLGYDNINFYYNDLTDQLNVQNLATTNLASIGSGTEILVTDNIRFNGSYNILANQTYYLTQAFNTLSGYWRMSSYPNGNTSETDYFELSNDAFTINFDQAGFSHVITPLSIQYNFATNYFYKFESDKFIYRVADDTILSIFPGTYGVPSPPQFNFKAGSLLQTNGKLISVIDNSNNDLFYIKHDTAHFNKTLVVDERVFFNSNQLDIPSSWSIVNGGTTHLDISGSKVTINNVLNLFPQSSAPGSPVKGDIYFNSTTNTAYCYDGSTWQALW